VVFVATRDTSGTGQFDCVECGINTLKIFEYYMLKNEIWNLAGVPDGMLCISCFEKKSDIVLTADHFTDYPINTGNFARSKLLQNRLDN
jgi:hypothetical protein